MQTADHALFVFPELPSNSMILEKLESTARAVASQ
jgi:hypothetical protein